MISPKDSTPSNAADTVLRQASGGQGPSLDSLIKKYDANVISGITEDKGDMVSDTLTLGITELKRTIDGNKARNQEVANLRASADELIAKCKSINDVTDKASAK